MGLAKIDIKPKSAAIQCLQPDNGIHLVNSNKDICKLDFAFQKKAVDLIWNDFRSKNSSLCVLPTGGGKTKVAIDLILKLREACRSRNASAVPKVLIIVPLSPLIKQFKDSLLKFGGTALYSKTAILAGSKSSSAKKLAESEVIIAMAQTLESRQSLPWYPSLVIWDEAHLTCYRDAWSIVSESFPKAKHVKLTATPWRLDAKQFPEDNWNQPVTTKQLIDDGYLVPYEVSLLSEINVKIKEGKDFSAAQAEKITTIASPKKVWDEWHGKYSQYHTIVFVPSHDVGNLYAGYFDGMGQKCVIISDEVPDGEREKAYQQFREEKVVLFSVAVLATGFDQPVATCAIVLRPTKSLALWFQMLGRVLRTVKNDDCQYLVNGKKDCAYILDFCGNSKDMPLPHEMEDWREWQLTIKTRECPECGSENITTDKTCKHCGYLFPIGSRESVVPSLDDVMADMMLLDTYIESINSVVDNRSLVKITMTDDSPEGYYRQCLRKAFLNGAKPESAYYKFKEKFPDQKPSEIWKKNAVFDGDESINSLFAYTFYLHNLIVSKGQTETWAYKHLVSEFGIEFVLKYKKAIDSVQRKLK